MYLDLLFNDVLTYHILTLLNTGSIITACLMLHRFYEPPCDPSSTVLTDLCNRTMNMK